MSTEGDLETKLCHLVDAAINYGNYNCMWTEKLGGHPISSDLSLEELDKKVEYWWKKKEDLKKELLTEYGESNDNRNNRTKNQKHFKSENRRI